MRLMAFIFNTIWVLPLHAQQQIDRYQVEAQLSGLRDPQEGSAVVVFGIPPTAKRRDGRVQNGDTVYGALVVDDKMESSVVVYGHWVGNNGSILKTPPLFFYPDDLERLASGFRVLAEGEFRFPRSYGREFKANLRQAITQTTSWPTLITFLRDIAQDSETLDDFFTERLAKDLLAMLEDSKGSFYTHGTVGIEYLFTISDAIATIHPNSYIVQDSYFRMIESVYLDDLPLIEVDGVLSSEFAREILMTAYAEDLPKRLSFFRDRTEERREMGQSGSCVEYVTEIIDFEFYDFTNLGEDSQTDLALLLNHGIHCTRLEFRKWLGLRESPRGFDGDRASEFLVDSEQARELARDYLKVYDSAGIENLKNNTTRDYLIEYRDIFERRL